jgi:arylsulfatase A-like enzyme
VQQRLPLRLAAAAACAILATSIGFASADGPVSSADAAAEAPNVVVVMTDDQPYGDARYMPNFRRVARRGARFTNAYVSFPICCPARATFLTGQYAHNHGVKSNFEINGGGFGNFEDQENTLPVWLQDAGYNTGFVGKYLNEYGAIDPTLIPPGWDDWRGLVDYSTYNYFNWAINENGEVHYHGDRDYAEDLIELARMGVEEQPGSPATGLAEALRIFQPVEYFGSADQADYQIDVTNEIADDSVRRMAAEDDPFFLYYAPVAAHREGDFESIGGVRTGRPEPDPRPPERYEDSFDDVDLPQDPSFNEADVSDKPETVSGRDPLDEETIEDLTATHRGQLGSLLAADDGVGEIMRTLRRAGELDDTLIVYTTDQGFFQGQHRIAFDKYIPYEPAIHVPLAMAGPGIPRGEVIDEPAYNHDLAPTILDAVGAEPGREQDGVSLLPTMRGDDVPERALLLEALAPALPYEIGNEVFDRQLPFHGVRTPNWKYIDWSSGDEELYDLREDPYELENLAAKPAYADEKERMSALADDLRGCAGSGCLGLGAEAGGGGKPLTAAEHRIPGRATGFVIGAALLVAAGAWAMSLARRRRAA